MFSIEILNMFIICICFENMWKRLYLFNIDFLKAQNVFIHVQKIECAGKYFMDFLCEFPSTQLVSIHCIDLLNVYNCFINV